MARTWILTGSPENYAATRAHDFSVIGLKERNRNRALEIEPGDRIVQCQLAPLQQQPVHRFVDTVNFAAQLCQRDLFGRGRRRHDHYGMET